jgi:hypothetical protein
MSSSFGAADGHCKTMRDDLSSYSMTEPMLFHHGGTETRRRSKPLTQIKSEKGHEEAGYDQVLSIKDHSNYPNLHCPGFSGFLCVDLPPW